MNSRRASRKDRARRVWTATQFWWVPIVVCILGGLAWFVRNEMEKRASPGWVIGWIPNPPGEVLVVLDNADTTLAHSTSGWFRFDTVSPGTHQIEYLLHHSSESLVQRVQVSGGSETNVIPPSLAPLLVASPEFQRLFDDPGSRVSYYELTSRTVGLALDNRRITLTIDSDGSARLSSGMVIRASGEQDIHAFQISYSHVPVPGSSSLGPRSEFTRITCSGGYTLELIPAAGQPSGSFLAIANITPILESGYSTEMETPLVYGFPGQSFMMTASASRARSDWPRDQFIVRNTYACNCLTIRVEFPPGYRPQEVHPDAYLFPESRIIHEGEFTRLGRTEEGAFRLERIVPNDNMAAELVIHYPIVGIAYGVSWLPPSEEG